MKRTRTRTRTMTGTGTRREDEVDGGVMKGNAEMHVPIKYKNPTLGVWEYE